jgi:uncharacterized membrane protein YkvA (DUF1232 family)
MWELLKELLKHETFLVVKYRAKGLTVVKPSSIALIALGILYLLSPIDLIPEAWITPKVFGFIDDIIVLSVISMYVYGDIGGVITHAEIRSITVPVEEKSIGPTSLPSTDGSNDHLVPVPASVPRLGGADSLEAYVRNNAVSTNDEHSVAPDSGQVIGDENAKPLNIYDHFLDGADKGHGIHGGEADGGGQRGELGDEDDGDKSGI